MTTTLTPTNVQLRDNLDITLTYPDIWTAFRRRVLDRLADIQGSGYGIQDAIADVLRRED